MKQILSAPDLVQQSRLQALLDVQNGVALSHHLESGDGPGEEIRRAARTYEASYFVRKPN